MTSRRSFLAGVMAATLHPAAGWADAGAPSWLAAAREADDSHALHGIRADGGLAFSLRLPGRGHAAAAHPTAPEAVAFARRPGSFALVIDCAAGRTVAGLTPPAGQQFNGHGAFVADGDILATSEVVAETSEGRIGLWDRRRGYRRVGNIPSGGIGPHEILALSDGSALVVANGGLRTDPGDRRVLNAQDFRSNLSIIELDGRVRHMTEPPAELRAPSLRHLALASDGTVAVAAQWQGDPAEGPPVLALWHAADGLAFVTDPGADLAMAGYAGSVAWDESSQHVAITSPRGGVARIHDRDGGVEVLARTDICGAAARPGGGFVFSDGAGRLWQAKGQALQALASSPRSWDNHMIALPPAA
jgi:hypothetical protein